MVFHSPRFAVTGIRVRGEEAVAGDVAAQIHLPPNTNFFLAPTWRLTKQVKRLPSVREASIRRDLQGHLIVTVERREAMAVIRGDKQARLVDANGVLFSVRNAWGWGLPELSAPHLTAGETTSSAAQGELKSLLDTLRALGPDPRVRVSRLLLDRNGEIEAFLDSGARVRMGPPDGLSAKVKLLGTALDQLGPSRIALLDLRDSTASYWVEKKAKKQQAAPAVP